VGGLLGGWRGSMELADFDVLPQKTRTNDEEARTKTERKQGA
jgi:hypothetical protein